MNNNDVAKELYESYCEAVGGVAYNGDPLPGWYEFLGDPNKVKQSDAWLAAANKALEMLKSIPENHSLGFGEALQAVKRGRRAARKGWNGEGMFIYLNKGSAPSLPQREITIEGISDHLFDLGDDGTVQRLPNINMRAATGSIVTGWLASQSDLLSEDWEVLD